MKRILVFTPGKKKKRTGRCGPSCVSFFSAVIRQSPPLGQIVKCGVFCDTDHLIPAHQHGVAAGDDQLLPAGEKDDNHIVRDIQLREAAIRVVQQKLRERGNLLGREKGIHHGEQPAGLLGGRFGEAL